MSKSTTALLRRIEDEREAKRQEAWANRGRADHKLPVWACDTLLRNGDIGADLHDAAQRYRSAIERSQGVIGATGEKVDGGDGDPHARLWDASVARQVARTARSFVLASPCSLRKRAAVLDALFAFVNLEQDSDGAIRHARSWYRDGNGKQRASWPAALAGSGGAPAGFRLAPVDRARLEKIPWKDVSAILDADPRMVGLEASDYADSVAAGAIATTTGIRVAGADTSAYLGAWGLAEDDSGTTTGFGFSIGRSTEDLRLEPAAADAVNRCLSMLGAAKAPSERLTVVFDPYVTSQFLGLVAELLSGEAVLRGRSAFAGRVGESVASPLVTLIDDPTDPLAPTADDTDGEGLATRTVPLISGGVLGGYLLFEYGRYVSGYDRLAALRAESDLQTQLDERDGTIRDLRRFAADLGTLKASQARERSELSRTIGELQAQVARQTQDLAFYKGIVVQNSNAPEVKIQELRVANGPASGRYVLHLMLVQPVRPESLVAGTVAVTVEGQRRGAAERLDLEALTAGAQRQISYSFRYFANLDPEIVIPADFRPERITVEVRSSRRGVTPLSQTFLWTVEAA